MSILSKQPVTRRGLMSGLLATWAISPLAGVAANQSGQPSTVDLSSGLEIRDYRLFPTQDAMRFIVEIHNTTDIAVDTPAVGVVLPNADAVINYGWATPVSTVLHPHTSGCLIGIAPAAVTTDEDWEAPEWMICDELGNKSADRLANTALTIDNSLTFPATDHARTTIHLSEFESDVHASLLQLHGIVRDANNRICGQTVQASLAQLETQSSVELTINIVPGLNYIANPFALLETVKDIEVSFAVQPRGQAVNRGCSPVWPWNR